jgi:hypothetical protein
MNVDTYIKNIHQVLYESIKKQNKFYFGTEGVLK